MRPIPITLVRRFAFPRDEAYAWLTDFEDADVDRAGAVIEMRKIVERAPRRVVYEGETAVLGRRAWSRTEVTLSPPDAWEGRVTAGPRLGSWTTYRLVPTSDGGCELTLTYNFVLVQKARMVMLRLLKPLVKRELEKMWDGYEAAMRSELGAAAQASSPAR